MFRGDLDLELALRDERLAGELFKVPRYLYSIHHAADKLKTRLKFKRWKTRWRVVLSSQVYIHHTADKLKTRLKFKRWKTRWRVGKVPRYLYSVHHKADKLKTRLKFKRWKTRWGVV